MHTIIFWTKHAYLTWCHILCLKFSFEEPIECEQGFHILISGKPQGVALRSHLHFKLGCHYSVWKCNKTFKIYAFWIII
jgi:hypothetical protein